ncbi:MAG: hypothetical protein M1816_005922 [Peltula sp. TS41687]|nr:MAG: hypothetical protein M1816_005922 [Peltula sp. TS41687]
MSPALLAPKTLAPQHVRTIAALFHVRHHAIGFHALRDVQRFLNAVINEYSEIDLNKEPCIIPQCGHILTVENMDGQMEMSKHYLIDESGVVTQIKTSSLPFSMKEVKMCAKCRGSLRNISRYGRIVRRALIDESSKKFITWANQQYLTLFEELHQEQKRLVDTVELAQNHAVVPEGMKLKLHGTREEQLKNILESSRSRRYDTTRRTRAKIMKYLHNVAVEEQPFRRVWDLVNRAKRHRETAGDMAFDATVLQTRQSLQAKSLLLRCDLAILPDFLTVTKKAEFDLDLKSNKEDCLQLIAEAQDKRQPAIEVEGHIFFARYCAIQRSYVRAEIIHEIYLEAKAHIDEAKVICKELPGQTRQVAEDVKTTENMLQNSTFYSVVTDDEWRAVMAAMATEFRGSGHWYTCQNNHAFTIGECGMPMELARCPQCGASVGGQHHQAAEGVRHAADLERRFGGLQI